MRRLLPVLLVSGCGMFATLQKDGHTVAKDEYEWSERQIRNRAAFELKCEGAQLSLTLLNSNQRLPTQVGVRGCGQRAVYVRVVSGYLASWVLDSTSGIAREQAIEGGVQGGVPSSAATPPNK